MRERLRSILPWIAGCLAALAAYALWFDYASPDIGYAPSRGVLYRLSPHLRYATRANYITGWSRGDMVRPTFAATQDADYDLACDVGETTVSTGVYWRETGLPNGQPASQPHQHLFLRISQRHDGISTYAVASDAAFTREALPVGGIDLPVASGTEAMLCLAHANAGRPNSEGAYPLWYCALSYSPASRTLAFVAFPPGSDPTADTTGVRQATGLCSPKERPTEKEVPPSASLTVSPEPSESTPPEALPAAKNTETAETVEGAPAPRVAGSSICTTSIDGGRVSCGPYASICSNSLDGNDVDCGGLSSICSTSLRGNDVACGGRSSICSTSLDGRRTACGGESSICSTSLSGGDVSCGGRATICSTSLDGRDVACGGLSTICSTSPNGGDVACGGLATICSTSPDGRDVACGGQATFCSTSPDGRRRACGGGLYTGD